MKNMGSIYTKYDRYLYKEYKITLRELEEIFKNIGFEGQGMFARQICRSNMEQVILLSVLQNITDEQIALTYENDVFFQGNLEKLSLVKVIIKDKEAIRTQSFSLPPNGVILKKIPVVQCIKQKFPLPVKEVALEKVIKEIFELLVEKEKFVPIRVDGKDFKYDKKEEAYVCKHSSNVIIYLDQLSEIEFGWPTSLNYRLILIPLNLLELVNQIGIGGLPVNWKFIPGVLTKEIIEKNIIKELPIEVLKESLAELTKKAQEFFGVEEELAGLYVYVKYSEIISESDFTDMVKKIISSF